MVIIRKKLAAAALTTLVALFTSAGAWAQSEAPRDNAKIWPYLSSLSPAERKTVLEREARKDGSITIYGATGLDRAQVWINAFNKLYPEIKVNFVRLTAEDMVQRVSTEARANRSQADLLFQTINYVDALAPYLAPYETSEWNNFDKRFLYGGKDKGWTSVIYEIFPMAIAWRTDRIPSDKAPKTLDQLASGTWNGKVGTQAHIDQLIGGLVLTYGSEEKMMPVLEKLASIKNRLYATHSALTDAFASGEVDLVWNLVSDRPLELKAKGAPVDWVYMDPLYAESNALMLLKDTKKPYATALFYDVMLSPAVLETSDKWSRGRLFGNKNGQFTKNIGEFPNLIIYPPIDPKNIGKWNMMKENLFVRRQ